MNTLAFDFDRQGLERSLADGVEVSRVLHPDEPLYLFSATTLEARARAFLDGFPGEVAYAVKSNPGAHVLKTLAAAGIEVFDVASVEEMEDVRAAAPHAVLHYHNPVKSRAEIARARFAFGCTRFAADDEAEIIKIADVVGDTSGIEIAIRFRLPSHGASAHDFSSKFGATPEEAADLLRQVVALGFAPVLTFHPGSQCTDPAAYARHIDVAGEIALVAGVRLAALNVGGGFPWRYRDGVVPALDAFFSVIEATANAAFEGDAPRLECEPGRGMVASSTSLLTRAKLVKGKRGEVFVNDGIYGGLMEVAQAPTLAPPHRVIRNGAVVAASDLKPFVVYGPTCDPLDRLPGTLMLPADLAEDDFIEFGSLGAYGAATSTCFNGYKPAAVVEVETAFSL
jgi:ornithine decarboxylase